MNGGLYWKESPPRVRRSSMRVRIEILLYRKELRGLNRFRNRSLLLSRRFQRRTSPSSGCPGGSRALKIPGSFGRIYWLGKTVSRRCLPDAGVLRRFQGIRSVLPTRGEGGFCRGRQKFILFFFTSQAAREKERIRRSAFSSKRAINLLKKLD